MSGTPDTRYMVLLALYSEYTRDDGDFGRITGKTLDMEPNIFGWALYRLQTEGLIEGCEYQPPNPQSANRRMGVLRDDMRLTGEGVARCEALLECDRDAPDALKRHLLADFFASAGANLIAWLILRTL